MSAALHCHWNGSARPDVEQQEVLPGHHRLDVPSYPMPTRDLLVAILGATGSPSSSRPTVPGFEGVPDAGCRICGEPSCAREKAECRRRQADCGLSSTTGIGRSRS